MRAWARHPKSRTPVRPCACRRASCGSSLPPGWAPGWQGPPRRQGAEGGGEETRMGEGEAQEGEVGRDGCHRLWGAGPSLRGPGGSLPLRAWGPEQAAAVRRAPEQDGDLSAAPDALSQGPWPRSFVFWGGDGVSGWPQLLRVPVDLLCGRLVPHQLTAAQTRGVGGGEGLRPAPALCSRLVLSGQSCEGGLL